MNRKRKLTDKPLHQDDKFTKNNLAYLLLLVTAFGCGLYGSHNCISHDIKVNKNKKLGLTDVASLGLLSTLGFIGGAIFLTPCLLAAIIFSPIIIPVYISNKSNNKN